MENGITRSGHARKCNSYFWTDPKDDEAKAHLVNARDFAQKSHEAALESVVIGCLTAHIAGHFHTALKEGEAMIREIFANSSDTLPQALGVAKDAADAVMK